MEKTIRDNDYLMEMADTAIAELVYDKHHLIKAYNYYSGIRDQEQFRHLEENFGLGNPTSISFTPLIRKHIDALVGEFLTLPIKPSVSCKDEKTLNNIHRDKQLAISKSIIDVVKPKLTNLIYSLIRGDGKNKINDAQFELELKNAQDWAENNFISDYEMAAQNIIKWILQSRQIDFKTKLRQLILDLFIAGEMYYRVEPTQGNNIDLQVLNPLNVFPDKNINSPYINDSYRVVYREYLSKPELLVKYGSELSAEDIKELDKAKMDYSSNNLMIVTANNTRFGCFDDPLNDGLEMGIGFTPSYLASPQKRVDLYCVYDVEWIDYDFDKNKNRIEHRYRVTRIGKDIYILWDEDKNTVRTMSSPNECKLSYNGLHYMSRTGRPYSLMLATSSLQDRYDVLSFYKESIIAQSGTAGDWVDLAFVPGSLGTELEDRLQKWIAYKKSGIALIDSSQEGVPMNTTFNGYDDTVRLQAIQAIELAIQDLENVASSITGVFRERLGGIEQRDAVANVEVGMQQSYIITKQYYQTMDTLVREMLLDSLNIAKIVYKKGFQGTLILGDLQKQIFTALPEHFTLTDFDIHLADSQDMVKEKETIKQITMELVKGQMVDPDILIAVSTSDSITEMKTSLAKSVKRKKEENNQVQQLTQQLEEAQKQLKEMEKELKKAQASANTIEKQRIQLETSKINKNYEVDMARIKLDREFNDNKIEQEKRRIELEALQLYDTNPKNDEIHDR